MQLSTNVFGVMGSAVAVNLYIASYNGNLTSLSLSSSPVERGSSASNIQANLGPDPSIAKVEYSYKLTHTTTFNTSAQSPAWLTLDQNKNILYLVDEAVTSGSGTLLAYKTNGTGHLQQIQRLEALAGGVYATLFASGTALAVPHYATSALTTYSVSPAGHLTPLETFSYSLAHPGPVPSRQDAPHPHEVVLDPTGHYLLVNDLGADLVRVYSVDQATKRLTALEPLHAEPGSGPRHGAFSLAPIGGAYVYYLGAEIAGTVTAYRVEYLPDLGGIAFTQVAGGVYDSLGPGRAMPPTTTGETTGVTAEVSFSPDGRFLLVSNRRDASFTVGGTLSSDSMATFGLQPSSQEGALEFLQLFPAGGSYPRHFALNRAGNLAAVVLQQNGTVAVLERDTETGSFVRQVALADVGGNVTCVVWDES